jgi:heptosyltransferase-1
VRVLVVKMSSLGDVIHTLPALSDAVCRLPNIRFDWVVEEAFTEIPAWHPAVDTVIPVALRRWRRRPLRDFRGPEWRRARASLARVRYDAVIDAQGLLKSAFITRLVAAPRYGMDRRSAREGLASVVYDHRVQVPRDMHAVERTRLLFSRALHYPPFQGQGDYGLAGTDASVPTGPEPTLMFCHGTARPEKLWPTDHWRALAGRAVAAGYRIWLPWGNDGERGRAQAIAAGLSNIELLPRSSLGELAARLRQVSAAVAVDTGLGHLAAALGVPSLSLYGPTRIPLVGTYGRRQAHLQSPLSGDSRRDSKAKMAAITPDLVWDALGSLTQGRW